MRLDRLPIDGPWRRRVRTRERRLRHRVGRHVDRSALDAADRRTIDEHVAFVARTPPSKVVASATLAILATLGVPFLHPFGLPVWLVAVLLVPALGLWELTVSYYLAYREARAIRHILETDPSVLLSGADNERP